MDDRKPTMPAHIEATIRAIARLHADHHRASTGLQRAVARLTDRVGRPRFIGLLTILVGGWVVANLLAPMLGRRAFDPPPFPLLSSIVTVVALGISVLILTTQRRDGELAQLREQLTLELTIIGEQKTAKIIELLETLRRDHPDLDDRDDPEAIAMATSADPHSVLDAIRQGHAEGSNAGRR